MTGLFVSTFGALTGAAQPIKLTVPATVGGKPTNVRLTVSRDPYTMAPLKAQNHLSAATNAALVKEKSSAGGSWNAPGIKNGTADTIPYFNSWLITGSRNSVYTYSMVGHNPKVGGTTGINNYVIPLVTYLYDQFGNLLYVFDPYNPVNNGCGTDYQCTLASPMWDATTTYPGPPADPTVQFTDSVLRASFNGIRAANWHTPLNPTLFRSIWGQNLYWNSGDWQCVGTEAPPCTSFPVVNINSISNNFAYILNYEWVNFGTVPNNTVPIFLTDFVTAYDPSGGCCILGYHTAQNGLSNPAGILVWTWATFIPVSGNPFGEFGDDVMVLTHEMSELYHDPFVNTAVAAWVDGSLAFAQGNLETGDVIENLAAGDAIYTAPLGGYTYHLQNEALLPWFGRNPVAGGLYSWPNIHTLSQCAHVLGPTNASWCYGEGSGAFYFGPPY